MVRASYESAFRHKDYPAALAAVQRIRNLDELDRGGSSLLGTAAYYGHADACEWLLDRGADIDVRDNDGRTPLLVGLWALGGGVQSDFILRAVRLLIDRGADVRAVDDEGRTTLHDAVRCAQSAPNLVSDLLDRGADPDARTGTGRTPLMAAAIEKHAPAVQALLAHGADPAARDQAGRDALGFALDFHHLDVRNRSMFDAVAALSDVDTLLAGADEEIRARVLVAAGYAGRVDVLSRGVDITASVGGRSLLDWAVWADDEATFQFLVLHGADLGAMLAAAVQVGHAEGVERCLRAGAFVHGARDALRAAARGCDEPILRLLRDHGADLTALVRHAAGDAGSSSVFEWCLEHGADPNQADGDGGSTALHLAVAANCANKVEVLLRHGADPAARDNDQRIPADLLRTGRMGSVDEMERDDIAQLLTG